MSILGKVPARAPQYCVENMHLGEVCDIHVDDIIVTRKALFIDILSPVISTKDPDPDIVTVNHIPIKKTGHTFTEKDFELDFSGLVKHVFIIEADDIYEDCIKKPEYYIAFTQFEFGANEKKVVAKKNEESLESLQWQLNRALEKEEYLKAKTIQDKIDAVTNRK